MLVSGMLKKVWLTMLKSLQNRYPEKSLKLTLPASIEGCARALETLNSGKIFTHTCKVKWVNPNQCEVEVKFRRIKGAFPNVGFMFVRGTLTHDTDYQLTRVSATCSVSRLRLLVALFITTLAYMCFLAALVEMYQSGVLAVVIVVPLMVMFASIFPFALLETRRDNRNDIATFLGVIERTLRATIPREPEF